MHSGNRIQHLVTLGILALLPGILQGQTIVDTWKYSLEKPPAGWEKSDFDAGSWKDGNGGFGTRDTPGSRVGTVWRGPEIWLRKVVPLESIPEKPALLVHHDEDLRVFINGQLALERRGYITEYRVFPLEGAGLEALRRGDNLLAVHCRQTGGGQFVDVHVIDARKVPALPEPPRSTRPYETELITPWGAELTPENAWTEYPRPQMRRKDWKNLNGSWSWAITPADHRETPWKWEGKILVPFALESALGGVRRLLHHDEALWYYRIFEASPREGQRMLLHFEAVDYESEIRVNGKVAGTHRGGNTPFSIDITDHLREGENHLVVRVEDDTEEFQLRGKQVRHPHGIWYTRVSGIWQTVWLEPVPATRIEDLKIHTEASTGQISVKVDVEGSTPVGEVRLVVRDGDREVARAGGEAPGVSVQIEDASTWSPESPHLYDLEVEILDAAGRRLDRVESYAGIRTLGKAREAAGHLRLTLNGEPIFHWGPLDQGWWPDGLLTPPSDEAMVFELEFLKKAGFNMVRKHIKVEPRRYYYHCDRLGLMVWQDQVSAGKGPRWTRLRPDPEDADWPEEHHRQFLLELERIVDALESHPSIVMWVPFNEAWGQHRTMEVGKWMVERDPTRAVNIASGGNFWPVGDVVDHHAYPHPEFPDDPARFRDFVKVMGEFGGHGYPVRGHLWSSDTRNWGYGGLPKNREEYLERYRVSIEKLDALRDIGIAAGVYTQTTDVEGEINGLMTYDRKVIKIPAEELAKIHRRLFEPRPASR